MSGRPRLQECRVEYADHMSAGFLTEFTNFRYLKEPHVMLNSVFNSMSEFIALFYPVMF